MKICKYCKKPISDNDVWNPDSEGNGYHHACLCEIEFRSRDRQMYDKGRADILDKIRSEIKQEYTKFRNKSDMWNERACGLGTALEIIDKYKADIRRKK